MGTSAHEYIEVLVKFVSPRARASATFICGVRQGLDVISQQSPGHLRSLGSTVGANACGPGRLSCPALRADWKA
jgi:hypothetical protein